MDPESGELAPIMLRFGENSNIEAEKLLWRFDEFDEWIDKRNKLMITKLDQITELDKFSQFFAQTLNKITSSLIDNQRVPSELFRVKDLFVEKVNIFNIEYVNSHVEKLLDIQMALITR